LRIWFFNHYMCALDHSGGTRHYSITQELLKRGHEVLLISTSFRHRSRRETRLAPGELWKAENLNGVEYRWIRTPPYRGNSLGRLWNMLVFARRVVAEVGLKDEPKPDVIVGSTPHPLAAVGAERLAARYGVPFLLEVRDIWPQSLIELGGVSRAHPFILLLGRLERYLYRRARKIFFFIPGAGDYLESIGFDRSKFVYTPNGLDLSLLADPTLPKREEPYTFMFAGAHGPANGLDQVIKAATLLRERGLGDEIRIRLIGTGPEKPRLMEMAREANLRSVRFEDPVSKSRIYDVLLEAQAFLMVLKESPVFRWGISPNKLYDYIGPGRPVLHSISTEYNPVEQSRCGLTAVAGDPRDLADTMERLYRTPYEEQLAMAERGRAYVEEHHDLSKVARNIEATMLEVVGEGKLSGQVSSPCVDGRSARGA